MMTKQDSATMWSDLAGALAATWLQTIPCQITTGGQCQRPAEWRVDVHGCEERLICTKHLCSWERHVLRVIDHGGCTVCALCALQFVDLESVRVVLPL